MTDVPASPPVAGPRPPDVETRPVLVVDDEPSMRHALARSLRRAGYVVEAAATGGEAIDRLAATPFLAAVVDLRLPDVSGLDLVAACAELRPELPVVVLTGYGTVDDATEALHHGARDFLRKPVGMDELVEVVAREVAAPPPSTERALRARLERRLSPRAAARVDDARRRAAAGARDGPIAATPPPLRDARRRFEVRYLERLLARTAGNVAAASRLARVSRPKLHAKLRSLGLDADRFRPERPPPPAPAAGPGPAAAGG